MRQGNRRRKRSMVRALFSIFLGAGILALAGCAANPVTGESELNIVSESWELEVGQEQYLPSRQMQGGDYNTDPELSRYVNQVGQRLARVSDRKLPYEFVVVNDSTPNAWALPGGKIALNRGLLVELDNEAELAAVLGHEVVHAAARHGAKGVERGVLLQGAVIATGIVLSDRDYGALAASGAALGAGLLNQKYDRDAEREADLYGMRYMHRAGYDPQAAVTLQETFVRLSKEKRQDWLSGLFASHPPSQERVENNRASAQRLGAGGELAEQRYREAIARLQRTKPAYDAYDEGVKALADGDRAKALRLADKAIQIEPAEGRFYALQGDAHFDQGAYRKALKDYDQALRRDPEYFQFYLHRGLTKEKLGDRSGAQKDLERSLQLLPTAAALNTLGQLALAEGEQSRGIDYLSRAARSDSAAGREAAHTLARVQPSRSAGPSNLGAELRLDPARNLVVVLSNPTGKPVREIVVGIRYPDRQGRTQQATGTYQGTLGPGQQVQLSTGIGPWRDARAIRGMRVQVLSSQVLR